MGLDIYFSRLPKKANKDGEREEREEVGYFRKVNFLVKYFEDNHGFSGESFDYLPVDKDMITDLKERCDEVLEDLRQRADKIMEAHKFVMPYSTSIDNSISLIKDYTNTKELKALREHTKAKELLPTTDGFFFGNTDYDEYYFRKVENVRDFCRRLLDEVLPNLDEDEEICFYIWY